MANEDLNNNHKWIKPDLDKAAESIFDWKEQSGNDLFIDPDFIKDLIEKTKNMPITSNTNKPFIIEPPEQTYEAISLPKSAIEKTVNVDLSERDLVKATNPDLFYIALGDVLLTFPPNSIVNVYDLENYWVFKNGDTLIKIDSHILNPYVGGSEITFPEILPKSNFKVKYTMAIDHAKRKFDIEHLCQFNKIHGTIVE